MSRKAKLRYFAKEFHLKEREFERIMMEHQTQGAFPIFRKGDVWIFEQFLVEPVNPSKSKSREQTRNSPGRTDGQRFALESITAI